MVSAQFQFSYKNSLSIDNRSSYFQVLTIVEIDSAITCAACQNAVPLVLCKDSAFMAHFADFDGAKNDSRNNLLKGDLPFLSRDFQYNE